MKPPKVPEVPVPVLTDDQLRALLKACLGKTFEDRRDRRGGGGATSPPACSGRRCLSQRLAYIASWA